MIDDAAFLYFISAGVSPVKIGISNDPIIRLSTLQTAHYKKLTLLFTLKCINRAAALELESAFHRWYEDRLIQLEWYDITSEDVTSDIRLLEKLSKLVIGIEQNASTNDLFKFKSKIESRNASKLELCISHLTQYPECVKLSGRELEKRYGIATYVLWNKAKSILKER